MINPFNPEDIPDEALWEITDPDFADRLDNLDDFNALYGEDEKEKDSAPMVLFDEGFKKKFSKKLRAKYPENFPSARPSSIITKNKKKFSYKTHFCVSEQDIPTQCTSDYWIHAYGKKFNYTNRTGKWLIFCPKEYINDAWEQVKDATEQDLLGGHSKVSTLKGEKGSEYVVCVFTSDWKNEKEVMEVRAALRDLGFEKPLPYKTDEDTLKKRYYQKGKPLSKYYE